MTNGLGGNILGSHEPVGVEELQKVWAAIPERPDYPTFPGIRSLDTVEKWESFIAKPEKGDEVPAVTQTLAWFINQNASFSEELGYDAMTVDRKLVYRPGEPEFSREEHFEAAILPGAEPTEAVIKLQQRRSEMGNYTENYSLLIPVNSSDFTPMPANSGGGALYYMYKSYGSESRTDEFSYGGNWQGRDQDEYLMGANLDRLLLDLIDAKQLQDVEQAYGKVGTPEHLLATASVLESSDFSSTADLEAMVRELWAVPSLAEAILSRRYTFADPERAGASADFAATVREIDDSYGYDCDIVVRRTSAGYVLMLPVNWHTLELRDGAFREKQDPVVVQAKTVLAMRDVAAEVTATADSIVGV